MKLLAFLLAATLAGAAAAAAPPVPPLKLIDGDRVVLVGATLVERDQQYGFFETMLHARFPRVAFTFRNLGWSGDTVWGDARAEFGTQKDGYNHLVQEVTDVKPTVLILCYGANEAFEGEAGLAKFVQQYETLLNDLAKTGPRSIWLVGPTRQEHLPPPLPDPAQHNRDLEKYNDAVRDLATRRGLGFIDLIAALPDGTRQDPPHPLTDDGLHFTAYGYWRFGKAVMEGLMPGEPTLDPAAGEAAKQLDAIRARTITKNRQFFYRWRPQNDTYIFGFRKHEQGKNAVEIPQFDPIVQKLEDEIAAASRPLDPQHVAIPAAPPK